MRMLRFIPVPAMAFAFATLLAQPCSRRPRHRPKITVGKIIGGSGFHIPSYVAMDQGFFKAEGLDAQLRHVDRPGAGDRRPVRQRRLHPDPVRRRAGGVERRRNPLRRRPVAEVAMADRGAARTSPSPRTLRARPSATAAPAPPTTTKARRCMLRAFKMEVGKDYKVISFQGEPERIAALVNGDIAGGADLGAARAAGAQRRNENSAAHRRLHLSAPAARSGRARPSSTSIRTR